MSAHVLQTGGGTGGSSSTYNPPNCIVGTGTDGVTSSAPNCPIGHFYDFGVNIGTVAAFDAVVRFDGAGYMESGSTGGAHMNLWGAQAGANGQMSITGSTCLDTGTVSLWGSVGGPQPGEWGHWARQYSLDGGGNLWVWDFWNGLLCQKVKIAVSGHYRLTPNAGTGSDQVYYFHSDHQNGIGRLAMARRFEGLSPLGNNAYLMNFIPQRPHGQTFQPGYSATATARANGYWKFQGDQTSFADLSDGYPGGKYLPFFVSTQQTGSGVAQNIAHGLGGVPDKVIVTIEDNNAANFVATQGTHDATNVVVTVTTGAKYRVEALLNKPNQRHTAVLGNGKAVGWPVPARVYDPDCPLEKVGDIYIPNGGLVPNAPALPGVPLFFDDFIRGTAASVTDTLAGLGPQDYYRSQLSGPNVNGTKRSDGSLGSLTWTQTMVAGAGWDVPISGRAAAIEYSLGTAGALLRSYATQPCAMWVSNAGITANHTVLVERSEAQVGFGGVSAGIDQVSALVRRTDDNNFIALFSPPGSYGVYILDYQAGTNTVGFNIGAGPTNQNWTTLVVKASGTVITAYVDSASGAIASLTDGNGNTIPSPTGKWEQCNFPAFGGFGGGTNYPDTLRNTTGLTCGTLLSPGGAGALGSGAYACKRIAGYKS